MILLNSKSGTPRTPKTDRKFKNRSALGSDDEIEDNLSYVDESSKVKKFNNFFD